MGKGRRSTRVCFRRLVFSYVMRYDESATCYFCLVFVSSSENFAEEPGNDNKPRWRRKRKQETYDRCTTWLLLV